MRRPYKREDRPPQAGVEKREGSVILSEAPRRGAQSKDLFPMGSERGPSTTPALRASLSNCLENQAVAACQGVPVCRMAFRIVSSFRMHATSATFFAFPAATSRV